VRFGRGGSAGVVWRDGDTFTAGCQLGSALIGDWPVEPAEELEDVSVRVGELNLLDVVSADPRAAYWSDAGSGEDVAVGVQRRDLERKMDAVAGS
jgi:hypothetical protein